METTEKGETLSSKENRQENENKKINCTYHIQLGFRVLSARCFDILSNLLFSVLAFS